MKVLRKIGIKKGEIENKGRNIVIEGVEEGFEEL